MAARKSGVYITPPIQALLREGDDSLSGRLATVAERYGYVLEHSKPDLSDAEWNACRDALNGVWLREDHSLGVVWAEISDADRVDGLGAKWDIDAQALSARIRDMRAAEVVALVEYVERWWSEHKASKDQ